MKQLVIQQGDVLFYQIDRRPERVKLHRNNVVAEGEATGHYHAVDGPGISVLELGRILFVNAPNGGIIRHQEHREIQIPAGVYENGIVREYDHFEEETRNV